MTHYELLYIVPIKFTEDELPQIQTKVNQLITGTDGKITLDENLGKKKLAYAIERFRHGHYIVIEFDSDPEKLKKINRDLKLSPEVLRFQIIKKKIKTAKAIERERKIQDKITQKAQEYAKETQKIAEPAKTKSEKKKDEGKISLEELDQKLDELLEE